MMARKVLKTSQHGWRLSGWLIATVCLTLLGFGWVIFNMTSTVIACPFCGPTAQTFTEEMESMDVVALVKLVHVPNLDPNSNELAKAKFEIVELIKGQSAVHIGDKIETVYFGDGKVGSTFLIMGIDPPRTNWGTPLMLTSRAKDYLNRVTKLPKEGNERYQFFQEYLEDQDETLARDAYDEFAKADYTKIKAMKPHMKHDQLVSWIQNPDIPASRRRLYFVMLGVCGGEADVPMLENYMKSGEKKGRQGLDALIACYLTLKGETGMDTVENLYLKNKKSDYADTYSAIMALRFHATEGGVIKRDRIVHAVKYMLERPELADLVIPDLAAWEDWTASDQLFELFKSADERSTWVRVPVINYLRRNPTEHAKELLKECEKIDPASVKRANTFFPGDPATPADPKKATQRMIPARGAQAVASAVPEVPSDEEEATAAVTNSNEQDETAAVVNRGADPAAAILKNPVQAPNRWLLLGVPWCVGLVLFIVQWAVLRGF